MASKKIAGTLAVLGLCAGCPALAGPYFVNGLVIDGASVDRSKEPGANNSRFGFFSDLYYDARKKEWWALSDRGPGGGVIDYSTRVQVFSVKVDKHTGAISKFKLKKTIRFTDPSGLLSSPTAPVGEPKALNGLNPLLLNGSVSVLGRSFDPEGIVIDPHDGRLIVADEYGPSIFKFKRDGKLVEVFATPANLVPLLADGVTRDYVSGRAPDGIFFGRQDNRGFEGLAITPDGDRLVAVLQDPLINEPGPNNGRDGRNLRVVVFDNDPDSATYGTSIGQYAYQLELQADVADRIIANGGVATPTDPRQGRNIGLSSVVALDDYELLVLERDNRGIGVDDPGGVGVTGTKRVYHIDLTGATDVTGILLPGGDLPMNVTPVAKSPVFIDLTLDTQLPNGKQAEKWEGLAVGPRLKDGSCLLLAGTDNDYSVTQTAGFVQYDVYVNFMGGSVQRDLDSPTTLDGVYVGPVPAGYVLIPGVLHSYKVPAAFLGGHCAGEADDDEDDAQSDGELKILN